MEIDPSVDVHHETNIRVQYRGPCSSSEPRIDHINFNFFNENITRDWLLLKDSIELIREERHPIMGSTFYLSRQQLLNSASAQETIKNNLIKNWALPEDVLNELVEEVLQDATLKVGQSVAPKYNILDMFVECAVEYDRTLKSDDELDMFVECTMEYDRALESDDEIEMSLKRKIIDSKRNESCSICLEELSSGCEAFCMPFSHMFHGDCIGEWLRTSHYCPNCRYEMPTY